MTEQAEKDQESEVTPPTDAPAADAQATLKAEVEALKDRLLRAVAETDNVRKRAQRDIEETAKYAGAAFARDIISAAENMHRTLDNISKEQRAKDPALETLASGVELTLKELLATFEKHGIKRIAPMGEKFDHNFHQAVMQVESPDHDAGTIVQVLQAGYVMNGRLLKPAMVGVVKQSEPEKKVDTTA